jgi:hypothetical protein
MTFLKPGPLTTFVHFLEHFCSLTSCDVLEFQVNLYFLLKLLAPIPLSVLKHFLTRGTKVQEKNFTIRFQASFELFICLWKVNFILFRRRT